MATEQQSDILGEKLEEIMRLYLTNESTEVILPLVDEAFAQLDGIEQMCQLLNFLPRALTTKNFMRVLESEQSKLSAQIAKANLAAVDEMVLDDADQRKLYLLMQECLAAEGAYPEDSQRMLLKYLATFNKVDEHVEEKACQAIIRTLAFPIWQFDEVRDLVPVRGLAASKKASNRQLLELFEIFCSRGINDYQAFYRENEELISEWGLSDVTLTEKIRLLSLCRIAQEKKAQENENTLTYSEIATTLNINEDEVESIIIRAVGLKLLSARVDQIKKVVKIGYTHHAMFTHDQWKTLQETLGAWKKNISDLLQKFQDLKAGSNSENQ